MRKIAVPAQQASFVSFALTEIALQLAALLVTAKPSYVPTSEAGFVLLATLHSMACE